MVVGTGSSREGLAVSVDPIIPPGCHWTGEKGHASLSAGGDVEVNSAVGHESGA